MTKWLLPATFLILAIGFALPAASDPWTNSDLIAPEVVAKAINAKTAPVILYVGFPVLYRAAHLPGAVLVGPTSKPEGLEAFKTALTAGPRDREVLIYCACCPLDRCPNLRPAFKLVKELGYKNVKIVMMPENLHTDWVVKGYPTEKAPS